MVISWISRLPLGPSHDILPFWDEFAPRMITSLNTLCLRPVHSREHGDWQSRSINFLGIYMRTACLICLNYSM